MYFYIPSQVNGLKHRGIQFGFQPTNSARSRFQGLCISTVFLLISLKCSPSVLMDTAMTRQLSFVLGCDDNWSVRPYLPICPSSICSVRL